MSPHALDLLSEIYTGKDYSTDEKELFVNMKGYTSSSKYLIWISTYTQRVNIFTGSKGQWKLFRACRCATGDKETPTPLGGFKLYARQSAQKYKHTYYRYLSKFFIKNSMHTRIRYYSGRFEDSRLGLPLSHGCVRLEDQNAKYIYQNVPLKTTVIVY
jgi:lipoprotein-anchoring transpeptidase ErfK/SrfK